MSTIDASVGGAEVPATKASSSLRTEGLEWLLRLLFIAALEAVQAHY